MLKNLELTNVMVHDIETVSGHGSFDDLNPVMQKLWTIKSKQIQRNKPEEEQMTPAECYEEMAGIYAEFGKICCISVGVFLKDKETGDYHLHIKSYYDHDERKLLLEFASLIEKRYNNPKKHYICGHNILGFDVPYICRRLIINGIPLPDALDIAGKKPWHTEHLLDTMTLWKFNNFRDSVALKLLCGVFGIPTPKDDIDGSEVGRTYWKEDDLDRIEVYCKKDVLATAQLLVRYKLMPLLREDQVHMI